MRTKILRTIFAEYAADGRLDAIIEDVDRRLAGPAPDPADWETRFWCARAAGDTSGMAVARAAVLASPGRPAWAELDFARLSLRDREVAEAADLYRQAWAQTPASWFADPVTGREVAEAFARSDRIGELLDRLTRQPLSELLDHDPDLNLSGVVALASRLRRADLNEHAACLVVLNWIRETVEAVPAQRRFFLAGERIAEAVLPEIADAELAFVEYSRRVCSPAWQRAIGVPRPGAVGYWGESWTWAGTTLDCMPGRWVDLAARLDRVPDLLAMSGRLEAMTPGDQALVRVLHVRAASSPAPKPADPTLGPIAPNASDEDPPHLDLLVRTWMALEAFKAGEGAEAGRQLTEVRTEALARNTHEARELAASISLALNRILAVP